MMGFFVSLLLLNFSQGVWAAEPACVVLKRALQGLNTIEDPRERFAHTVNRALEVHERYIPSRRWSARGRELQRRLESRILNEAALLLSSQGIGFKRRAGTLEILASAQTRGWITRPEVKHVFDPKLVLNRDSSHQWTRAEYDMDSSKLYMSGWSLLFAGLKQQDPLLAHESSHVLTHLEHLRGRNRLLNTYLGFPETDKTRAKIPDYASGFWSDEIRAFLDHLEKAWRESLPPELEGLTPVTYEKEVKSASRHLRDLGWVMKKTAAKLSRKLGDPFVISQEEWGMSKGKREIVFLENSRLHANSPEVMAHEATEAARVLYVLGDEAHRSMKGFSKLSRREQGQRIRRLRKMIQSLEK